jgi:hypothetical protein
MRLGVRQGVLRSGDFPRSGCALGYDYPAALDQRVTSYLEEVHRLPHTADS